jgi:hypothetical protein
MRLKSVIFAAVMLLPGLWAVSSAFAEDVVPTPAPTETPAPAATPAAPAPGQKFWLEVDQSDLAAISQALNELPKRMADPLILKLNAQLKAQETITKAKDEAEKSRKRK